VHTGDSTLGHARLSIIDVANGLQPMTRADASIVFNGEIYNYQELGKALTNPLKTDSDTEVLLQLYRQFGPECVSLLDGMFAFAIADGSSIFLARDPLGIKPLYYAAANGTLYFASEIKAIHEFSADVKEFPAGHWWHSDHGLSRYYQLDKGSIFGSKSAGEPGKADLAAIKNKLRQAVHKRMIADPSVPVGVSLSGGLDSSIVAAFAKEIKEDLNTFVVGVPGSADLEASRDIANHLGTTHHVYEYTVDEMVAALPEVIYHLESFDAALIRSAIPNYFLARLSSEHVKVILTGEGADELYAGYEYLDSVDDPAELQQELFTITGNLHNTNLQRADRMSMAFGLEARVPFLDKAFVDYSLSLPAEWKLQNGDKAEKELLRNACKDVIPARILNRPKQKFSDGAGSMAMLAGHANQRISDKEFAEQRVVGSGLELRSKEELLYFQIFQDAYGSELDAKMVGRTRSITDEELQ
jgi:asparagine synthase (glutamine-hydrolysing)